MLVLLYVFVGVVCIQLYFYLAFFSRFSFGKHHETNNRFPSVSVVICAKNEAENLRRFLPKVINQKYPKFQVVLINDASYDDTLEVMEDLQSKHPNLIKIVNVKNNEAFWANKKYALTLGIKAAKYEYLIFTDADCEPASDRWLQHITSQFTSSKRIVLGYGPYFKVKHSFLNKLIRFETLMTAIQYFSYAKAGMPYMGVGRNLAYTKNDFFKVNGFIKHMHVRSGDDDLFINQVAQAENTAICIHPESFTFSTPKQTWKTWFDQKRRHISTAQHYKPLHKVLLALYYSCNLLFWLLMIILLISQFEWKIVLGIIAIKFILQWVIVGFGAKKLHERDLLWLLPFYELLLICFQLTIFISNRISKPAPWKQAKPSLTAT